MAVQVFWTRNLLVTFSTTSDKQDCQILWQGCQFLKKIRFAKSGYVSKNFKNDFFFLQFAFGNKKNNFFFKISPFQKNLAVGVPQSLIKVVSDWNLKSKNQTYSLLDNFNTGQRNDTFFHEIRTSVIHPYFL